MTDFLDELSHSWGNTPKQKQREKEYNHEYYLKNKEKWQKYADDIDSQNIKGKYGSFRGQMIGSNGVNSWIFNKVRTRVSETDAHPKNNEQVSNLINAGYILYKGKWYKGKDDSTRKWITDLYKRSKTNAQKRSSIAAAENEASKEKSRAEKISRDFAKEAPHHETQKQRSNRQRPYNEARNQAMKESETYRSSSLMYDIYKEKKRHSDIQRAGQKARAELEMEASKPKDSTAKKVRNFIDGTVEVAMDRAADSISSGKKFLKDFFG